MKNTENSYGLISVFLHWSVAIIVFGLFGLGFWMVDLGYYDPWYQNGPALHKSIGFILFTLMMIRVIWKGIQTSPNPIATLTQSEQLLGKLMHQLLYLMLFILMISGYLISTADGRGIAVFELFTLPSFGEFFDEQEDISGVVHQYVAYVLIAFVVLHAIAALKHHYIDKDQTLNRMLGKNRK